MVTYQEGRKFLYNRYLDRMEVRRRNREGRVMASKFVFTLDELEKIKTMLVAAERERCARICDEIAARFDMTVGECPAATCAAAIRKGE